jgi:hypothetical protein
MYRECLEMTKEKTSAQLVLIDPFYLSTDFESGSQESKVLEMIMGYLAVVEKLSSEFEALHVETHTIFQNHLKYRPRGHFCPEPVHPNQSGHMVIALSLLDILGF